MWEKLCHYLDENFKIDTDYFLLEDDEGNDIQPIVTYQFFNKYWHALGEKVVQFYIEHEDCSVPFGIDSKMMRYSLKKKYISPAIAFSRITKIK